MDMNISISLPTKSSQRRFPQKLWEKTKNAKSTLPIDVHRSATSLLELPNIHTTTQQWPFQTTQETASVLCSIALWDFGDEFCPSFCATSQLQKRKGDWAQSTFGKTFGTFTGDRKKKRLLRGLSNGVFQRHKSTGCENFSLLICLDVMKFVLLSFFTLVETI